MTSFWDDSWQRESVILRTRPDSALMQREMQIGRALGHRMPEGFEFVDCSASDGLLRMATVGPDYDLLVPAIHRTKVAELQKRIGRLTFYFICTRPRIRLVEGASGVTDGVVRLTFEALLDDGTTEEMSHEAPAPSWLREIEVEAGGTSLALTRTDGHVVRNDVALVAQTTFAKEPYQPSVFDLKIHYIGRARGAVEKTCALDRLENHEKYQRVMEEVLLDPFRNRDVWLILASGTTIHLLSGHEKKNYGERRLREGDDRARALLTESDRIDLTEALLINYFKPHLNTQHVKSLNLKGTLMTKCRRARLTGLTLVYETRTLGNVAAYTEHIAPRLEHAMTVPLT